MTKTVEYRIESHGTDKDNRPVFGFLSFTLPCADGELMHPDGPPEEMIDAMKKAAEIMGVDGLQIITAQTVDSARSKAMAIASRPYIS